MEIKIFKIKTISIDIIKIKILKTKTYYMIIYNNIIIYIHKFHQNSENIQNHNNIYLLFKIITTTLELIFTKIVKILKIIVISLDIIVT